MMFKKMFHVPALCLALALSFSVLTGCKEKEEAKPETLGDMVKKTTDEVTKVADEVKTKLVDFDKADGKEDKVISKCAGCSLKMDGSAEHKLDFAGYTFHMCSGDCVKSFGKDIKKSVMDLEI